MRVVTISDTHNHLDISVIPDGDLLIHAGDATNLGTVEELNYFFSLFCSLPHKHKVFVPGNHDCLMYDDPRLAFEVFHLHSRKNDHILINSSVTIEGLRIFGFPYIPKIRGRWAFERTQDDLWRLASRIPLDIEILITHCPPFGTLDKGPESKVDGTPGSLNSYGIQAMATTTDFYSKRSKLKTVVCGHIHEDYSVLKIGEVTFYNSAIASKNLPHVFDL